MQKGRFEVEKNQSIVKAQGLSAVSCAKMAEQSRCHMGWEVGWAQRTMWKGNSEGQNELAQHMSDGWYTQSNSAEASIGMVQMPIGVS